MYPRSSHPHSILFCPLDILNVSLYFLLFLILFLFITFLFSIIFSFFVLVFIGCQLFEYDELHLKSLLIMKLLIMTLA